MIGQPPLMFSGVFQPHGKSIHVPKPIKHQPQPIVPDDDLALTVDLGTFEDLVTYVLDTEEAEALADEAFDASEMSILCQFLAHQEAAPASHGGDNDEDGILSLNLLDNVEIDASLDANMDDDEDLSTVKLLPPTLHDERAIEARIIVEDYLCGKNRRLCKMEGCHKRSRSHGLCISHGGGRRCAADGCNKSSQGGNLCIKHGGGKRCEVQGCERAAQSNMLCKAHGGGPRCLFEGCDRSSQGGGYCRSHGGGKRCLFEGCDKGTQRGDFCALHGGSRLCGVAGCMRNDRGGGYCATHGGGKRCAESGLKRGAPIEVAQTAGVYACRLLLVHVFISTSLQEEMCRPIETASMGGFPMMNPQAMAMYQAPMNKQMASYPMNQSPTMMGYAKAPQYEVVTNGVMYPSYGYPSQSEMPFYQQPQPMNYANTSMTSPRDPSVEVGNFQDLLDVALDDDAGDAAFNLNEGFDNSEMSILMSFLNDHDTSDENSTQTSVDTLDGGVLTLNLLDDGPLEALLSASLDDDSDDLLSDVKLAPPTGFVPVHQPATEHGTEDEDSLSGKNRRLCKMEGCHKRSRSHGLCIAHGGGRRCAVDGCNK
ncbi:hypothetical protein ACHHYP_09837, partial [Achlya hypogyna]